MRPAAACDMFHGLRGKGAKLWVDGANLHSRSVRRPSSDENRLLQSNKATFLTVLPELLLPSDIPLLSVAICQLNGTGKLI
jgi:hypothetical protein